MNTGKCPACKAIVTHVKVEEVRFCVAGKPDGKGLSIVCSECDTVLSVAFDPVSIIDSAAKAARAPRA